MHRQFLSEAVKITTDNIKQGGRPFGAVVVKDGEIIARAVNTMLADHDPTAHAEMMALRQAGKALQSVNLAGCIVYASGEPCPMCQAAMYMAGIREVYFVFSNHDGEPYHLSTAEIAKIMQQAPAERKGSIFQQVSLEEKSQYPDLYALWNQQKI